MTADNHELVRAAPLQVLNQAEVAIDDEFGVQRDANDRFGSAREPLHVLAARARRLNAIVDATEEPCRTERCGHRLQAEVFVDEG